MEQCDNETKLLRWESTGSAEYPATGGSQQWWINQNKVLSLPELLWWGHGKWQADHVRALRDVASVSDFRHEEEAQREPGGAGGDGAQLKAAEAQRGRHLGAEQASSGVAWSPKGTTAAWVTPASGGDLDELVRLSIVSRAVKKKRPHPCLTHIMHRADHKNLSQAFQVDFVFEHNKFSKTAKL